MATIALFHSVLGVRPGIEQAAALLASRGHVVRVIDQYDGRTFDDYDAAMAYVDEVGMEAMMAQALELTADLPEGFVTMGFSNGGAMAGSHIDVITLAVSDLDRALSSYRTASWRGSYQL